MPVVFIFPSNIKPGAALCDLKRSWSRIRRAAGCPDLRIHDLRHSVATWMADAGTPAQVIQQALGHSNIQHTLGYIHASDQAPRAALDALAERILRPAGDR